MTTLKYPQEVSAEMQRFKDANGRYYLDSNKKCLMIRNKTRIHFDNTNKLAGTVIMTNPGSYGLNKINGWDAFISGKGNSDTLSGKGSPDLTMQNLICVIEESYKKSRKSLPNGFVDIYNISSVVCPKGEDAFSYHNKIEEIINTHNLDTEILSNPVAGRKDKFEDICRESPFVILGFVKGIFEERARDLMIWSAKYSNKIVYSLDKSGWCSHPRRWRTEPYLKENVIELLSQII